VPQLAASVLVDVGLGCHLGVGVGPHVLQARLVLPNHNLFVGVVKGDVIEYALEGEGVGEGYVELIFHMGRAAGIIKAKLFTERSNTPIRLP